MASSSQWKYCFYAVLIVLSVWASKVTSRTLTTESSPSMHERHQQWMTQHKIVYKDSAEQERRFEIFKTNVEYIDSFNNGGNKTYKLGINKFTDQSDEEFHAQRTGLKMPLKQQNYGTQSFKYENVTNVPDKLDWSLERGAVTTVKDQGVCGSCWAFAGVAAIEGAIKISTGNLIDLSEQVLIDCDTSSDGCGGGNMANVFTYVARAGIPTETNYGYTGTVGTCDSSKAAIRSAVISGFEYVPSEDETALLKAVANQPVSVVFAAGDFEGPFRHYSSGVFTGDCGPSINHALTIVGYGTTNDGTKYWLAKNSWGPGWGEVGHVKLKRDIDSKEAKIIGFEYVPSNDEISLLKAVANQPVSVGIDAGENGSPFRHYSSGVFTGDCGTNLNHAVTIVGYGESSDGTKYWLAKNSWGSTWGEEGYVKLKRFADSKEGLCGLAKIPTYPIV